MSRPVVVITGCSGTLGTRTAQLFAAEGYLVAGVDIVAPTCELAAFVEGDASDPSVVDDLITAANSLGSVRHAVCLVSDAPTGEPDDTPGVIGPERLGDAVAARLEPAWVLMSGVEPELSGQDGNRSIVLRCTDSVLSAGPAEAVVAGAVESLVRHSSATLAEVGIRVCAVAVPDADDTTAWADPVARTIVALALELPGVTGAVLPVTLA